MAEARRDEDRRAEDHTRVVDQKSAGDRVRAFPFANVLAAKPKTPVTPASKGAAPATVFRVFYPLSRAVTDNGDGTKTITCTDSTTVTVSDGQNGSSTLITNEILQDGDPNCPAGGIAVHTGIDSDGNGLLEGDEIASTSYLCNGQNGEVQLPTGVLQGSYTIRNSLDVYFLSSVTSITRDLLINAPGLTSFFLPALTSVGGEPIQRQPESMHGH